MCDWLHLVDILQLGQVLSGSNQRLIHLQLKLLQVCWLKPHTKYLSVPFMKNSIIIIIILQV